MTVYPAAIELEASDFNYAQVLSLPWFLEGGPNTHTTSIYTLLVALLIRATGSLPASLPILHLLSFALAGLLGAGVFRIVALRAPPAIALLAASVALLFPPQLAETVDIYLDLPIAVFGTWALFMTLSKRWSAAGFLLLVGVLIKPLAILFAATIGVFLVAQRTSRSQKRPCRHRAFLSLVGSHRCDRVKYPLLPLHYKLWSVWTYTAKFLLSMPDLMVLFGSVVLVAVAHRRQPDALVPQMQLGIYHTLSLLLFAILNPFVTYGIPLLARYYVTWVPIAIAGLFTQLWTVRPRAAVAAGTTLLVVFAANSHGTLYLEQDTNLFAFAERSLAADDLLTLHQVGAQLLADKGEIPAVLRLLRPLQVHLPTVGILRHRTSQWNIVVFGRRTWTAASRSTTAPICNAGRIPSAWRKRSIEMVAGGGAIGKSRTRGSLSGRVSSRLGWLR